MPSGTVDDGPTLVNSSSPTLCVKRQCAGARGNDETSEATSPFECLLPLAQDGVLTRIATTPPSGAHTRASVLHVHHPEGRNTPARRRRCWPAGQSAQDGQATGRRRHTGLPVGRTRSITAGRPLPCTPFGARAGRDRPAGRHHGSRPARIPRHGVHTPPKGAHGRRPAYGRHGVRWSRSRELSHPYLPLALPVRRQDGHE